MRKVYIKQQNEIVIVEKSHRLDSKFMKTESVEKTL